MSIADTVDDLHAAEDFAGRAVEALRTLAAGQEFVSYRDIDAIVADWDSYCRPTCNPNDDGPHDEVCEEGPTCGCPCRDREQAAIDAEPPERELPGEEP